MEGQPDYTVELQFSSSIPIQSVVAAAEAAGAAILQIYKSEVSDVGVLAPKVEPSFNSPMPSPSPTQASKWDVQLKSDNSPLTRADSAANQIICDELTVSPSFS